MRKRNRSSGLVVIAGLLFVGQLFAEEAKITEPVIHVNAMFVKLPTDKLILLGDKLTLGFNMEEENKAPTQFTATEMKTLRSVLRSPQTEAVVLASPSVVTKSGERAELTVGGEKIYYILPAEDNHYKLHSMAGPRVSLKVTPAVYRDDWIKLSLDVTQRELKRRKEVSEAPGLQAGIPEMISLRLSTTMTVSDGKTYLLHALRNDSMSVLVFVTAYIRN